MCPPGTPVISLQNGVDNVAHLTALAPELRVLAGMVPYNVVLRGAHVHRATAGHLQLQRSDVTEGLAPLFNAAGLATVLPYDIRAVQWGQAAAQPEQPGECAVQPAAARRAARPRLPLRLCRAAVRGTGGDGARRYLPGQGHRGVAAPAAHVLRLPNWLFTRLARRMLQIDAQARSSMWDDLEAGRVTEIDAICGAVVRLPRSRVGRRRSVRACASCSGGPRGCG